jgi:hypothetical protein
MKVLIACEESQRVCIAFRERGHEAYSCDIQECSGGHPEWHIKDDVKKIVNGYCQFTTQDGKEHTLRSEWDLIIAHPPCTYLSTAATQCHSVKCYTKEEIAERTQKRIDAMAFFMMFVNAHCKCIAIENPTGVMNTCFRKPDQTIQPYYFAESVEDKENYVTKKTGLWLKNLPVLVWNCDMPNPMDNAPTWLNGKKKNWTESNHGQKCRSKTFPGIAKAMAEQWG